MEIEKSGITQRFSNHGHSFWLIRRTCAGTLLEAVSEFALTIPVLLVFCCLRVENGFSLAGRRYLYGEDSLIVIRGSTANKWKNTK